jgi:hypothetical protein
MARYKQSETGERLTAGCHLQLTPTQRHELQAAADASGERLSNYVRDRLFRKGGQPVVAAGVRRNPEAKAMMDELRRIGNNLNQLTHHANAQGLITEQRELHGAVVLLKAAMSRVISL